MENNGTGETLKQGFWRSDDIISSTYFRVDVGMVTIVTIYNNGGFCATNYSHESFLNTRQRIRDEFGNANPVSQEEYERVVKVVKDNL